MATKDGRHMHVSSHGGLTLRYADCPCWSIRPYSSVLSPIPGQADEAYAAAVSRLRASGLWINDELQHARDHDDDVREGWR